MANTYVLKNSRVEAFNRFVREVSSNKNTYMKIFSESNRGAKGTLDMNMLLDGKTVKLHFEYPNLAGRNSSARSLKYKNVTTSLGGDAKGSDILGQAIMNDMSKVVNGMNFGGLFGIPYPGFDSRKRSDDPIAAEYNILKDMVDEAAAKDYESLIKARDTIKAIIMDSSAYENPGRIDAAWYIADKWSDIIRTAEPTFDTKDAEKFPMRPADIAYHASGLSDLIDAMQNEGITGALNPESNAARGLMFLSAYKELVEHGSVGLPYKGLETDIMDLSNVKEGSLVVKNTNVAEMLSGEKTGKAFLSRQVDLDSGKDGFSLEPKGNNYGKPRPAEFENKLSNLVSMGDIKYRMFRKAIFDKGGLDENNNVRARYGHLVVGRYLKAVGAKDEATKNAYPDMNAFESPFGLSVCDDFKISEAAKRGDFSADTGIPPYYFRRNSAGTDYALCVMNNGKEEVVCKSINEFAKKMDDAIATIRANQIDGELSVNDDCVKLVSAFPALCLAREYGVDSAFKEIIRSTLSNEFAKTHKENSLIDDASNKNKVSYTAAGYERQHREERVDVACTEIAMFAAICDPDKKFPFKKVGNVDAKDVAAGIRGMSMALFEVSRGQYEEYDRMRGKSSLPIRVMHDASGEAPVYSNGFFEIGPNVISGAENILGNEALKIRNDMLNQAYSGTPLSGRAESLRKHDYERIVVNSCSDDLHFCKGYYSLTHVFLAHKGHKDEKLARENSIAYADMINLSDSYFLHAGVPKDCKDVKSGAVQVSNNLIGMIANDIRTKLDTEKYGSNIPHLYRTPDHVEIAALKDLSKEGLIEPYGGVYLKTDKYVIKEGKENRDANLEVFKKAMKEAVGITGSGLVVDGEGFTDVVISAVAGNGVPNYEATTMVLNRLYDASNVVDTLEDTKYYDMAKTIENYVKGMNCGYEYNRGMSVAEACEVLVNDTAQRQYQR